MSNSDVNPKCAMCRWLACFVYCLLIAPVTANAQQAARESAVEQFKALYFKSRTDEYTREDAVQLLNMLTTVEGAEQWFISQLYDLERTAKRISALMKQPMAEQMAAIEKGEVPGNPKISDDVIKSARQLIATYGARGEAAAAGNLKRALEAGEEHVHERQKWMIRKLSVSRSDLTLAALSDFAKNGHPGYRKFRMIDMGTMGVSMEVLQEILAKPGERSADWFETQKWVDANVARLSPLVKPYKEGVAPGAAKDAPAPAIPSKPSANPPAPPAGTPVPPTQAAVPPEVSKGWKYFLGISACVLALAVAVWFRIGKRAKD